MRQKPRLEDTARRVCTAKAMKEGAAQRCGFPLGTRHGSRVENTGTATRPARAQKEGPP
jgi:hypothetical protein